MRLIRALAGFVLALILVAVVLAGGLAWRLGQGPLDVTGLAQRLLVRYAPELQVAQVTLAWAGFNGGPRSLHLVAHDAKLLPGGEIGAAEAAVALSFPRLLQGLVEPGDLVVDGLRVHATRTADGEWVVAGLPPGLGRSGGGSDPSATRIIGALTHVSLHDAQLTLTDTGTGQTLNVGEAAIDLRRPARGGVTGDASARLEIGGVTVTASLKAQREAAGVTRLQVELSPVSPATLAAISPKLAPLAMLQADVTLHAQAEVAPDLALRHAAIQAEAGAGTALVPAKGGGTSPAHFASATVNAEGNLSRVQLNALQVVLAPPSGAPPTTISFSGTAARNNGHIRIQVAADVDQVAMTDLSSLWPPRTGGGARPWLTENVTQGNVHDGHFNLLLEGTGDGDDLDLTQATGTMAAEDVTLYWLRPVPPVEHGAAVLTLETPDALTISFTGARQGRIVERAGNIHITGMSTPHQFGLINLDLAAPVAEVVKLLSYPKMNMLSAHPLPLSDPAGDLTGHLTVHIPLEDHVEFDDVAIHATANITNLHLGGFAEGQNLDHGTVAMDVTNDALKATATAQLASMPSQIQADMDFRNGGPSQVTTHIAVGLHATEPQLAAAGLDTFKLIGGMVAVKLDYAEQRSGKATVQLNADILQTTVDTPFGWSKTAGSVGFMEARAELMHGRLVNVDRLRAEAPGLSVAGRSEIVNGRAAVLHIERAVVGRTSATGTVSFPATASDPLRITLLGPRLDLTGFLDARPGVGSKTAKPAADATKPVLAQPLAVDLRFGQVFLKQGAIGAVSLTAEGSTSRINRAQLHTGGIEAVQASLAPLPGARRHLSVTSADLGALLRVMDVTPVLADGKMALTGDFDDAAAGSPFAGELDLDNFRVKGAPFIGKVLQGLTLYGLVDALRGPGLVFDKMMTRFRWDGRTLQLADARAFSSSLGVTAKGDIDLDHSSLVVEGTVVPAYAINALPGIIPLIGRLFSPERGGGVFAATYSLHGSLADPDVHFNPLAALTPGFLRGVFGMLP